MSMSMSLKFSYIPYKINKNDCFDLFTKKMVNKQELLF